MKILVIGAAGKTGKAVVEQALAAGHTVTAFVHEKSDFSESATLRVVKGDATNRTDMDQAVRGQDAVLDTLGGKVPYKETTLEASAVAIILQSMRDNEVRRLVVLSMLGEGDSKANTNLYERILMSTFLRGTGKDKAEMETTVESTDLDWTILRPPFLTDEPATGSVKVFSADMKETAHKITRSDLAAFIIAEITSKTHLRQAITIANS
jgi:putative NADH-flavin reductase